MKMSSARVRCKSVPSRELSTLILHRDTGITDPERPFKHECSCGRWFTALDWHLHGCWTGSECQYDEPPSILHEYERFLAYDLLCEALGQVGVLAPIRYNTHPEWEREGKYAWFHAFRQVEPSADGPARSRSSSPWPRRWRRSFATGWVSAFRGSRPACTRSPRSPG